MDTTNATTYAQLLLRNDKTETIFHWIPEHTGSLESSMGHRGCTKKDNIWSNSDRIKGKIKVRLKSYCAVL